MTNHARRSSRVKEAESKKRHITLVAYRAMPLPEALKAYGKDAFRHGSVLEIGSPCTFAAYAMTCSDTPNRRCTGRISLNR